MTAGWSAPLAPTQLDAELSALPDRATTAGELGPSSSVQSDPWEFNNASDPILAAHREQHELQRQGIDELRRHNDLLQANHTTYPTAGDRRLGPVGSPRLWLAKLLLGAAVLLGTGLFLAAWMLSIAAAGYPDLEPPTFTEIETGIHQRTAERIDGLGGGS